MGYSNSGGGSEASAEGDAYRDSYGNDPNAWMNNGNGPTPLPINGPQGSSLVNSLAPSVPGWDPATPVGDPTYPTTGDLLTANMPEPVWEQWISSFIWNPAKGAFVSATIKVTSDEAVIAPALSEAQSFIIFSWGKAALGVLGGAVGLGITLLGNPTDLNAYEGPDIPCSVYEGNPLLTGDL